MPALLLLWGAGIKILAAYAVTRVLLALGLSYVVYQGMDTLLDMLQGSVEGYYGGLPAIIHSVITLSGADVAISILFSAVAVRLLLNGFVGGAKSAFQLKGISAGGG